jgi:hypothetical protein
MNPAPFLLFTMLLALFMNEYIENKFTLFFITALLAAVPFAYILIRKKGVFSPKPLGLIRLGGSSPIYEFSGSKHSASAIMISTNVDSSASSRIDNELNYERLCKFSDALSSFGAPAAYIFFSTPEKAILGQIVNRSISKSLILMWSKGKDEKELTDRSELYMKQLEGMCSIVFPNSQTRRMGKEELSILLSTPLPFALPELIPLSERIKPIKQTAVPVPPPPRSPDPTSTLAAPDIDAIAGNGPFLGWVFSNGKQIAPISLSIEDMQRHTSIFGATGSGKSTTAISVALRLTAIGVSVLILDWHGEHTNVIMGAGGKVFSPGSDQHSLTINPLAGCSSKDKGFQVEFITDVFTQIFQFTAPQSYMFRETLKACYRSKIDPTLSDLLNELGLMPIRSSWDHETRMALMRRLKLFTEGTCGMAVNGKDSLYRDDLFNGLVSIDLSHLKDVNSRAIFSNFILKMIYDYSVDKRELGAMSHVVFIEEAQNILPPRRPEMPRSIGERILGELRKFGVGVVVISQFPSSISQDVVKNTAIRIIHAIRSGEDLKAIGDATAMNLKQIDALTSLSIGEAIVNLPHRSSNVFVKMVPDPLLGICQPSEAISESCLPSQA